MSAPPTDRAAMPPELRDGYVLAAAVTDTFEPGKLAPVKGFEGDLGILLDVSVMSEKPDGAVEWRLPNHLRRAALQVLAGSQQLAGTLEANRKAAHADSPYQRIFEDLLTGKGGRLEDQNLEQLQASLNAVKVLEGVVPALPDPEEIRGHLVHRDFIRQFETLAGRNFVGRKQQLEQLQAFVDVLPQGLGHLLRRSAAGFLGSLGVHHFLREVPLMITGMGGIGKSALLSKFLLEHLHSVSESPDLLIAYVDFDKPGIWPGQPLTVLAEIAQQLALQVRSQAGSFRRLSEDIVRELAVTGSYSSEYDSAEAVNSVATPSQSLASGSIAEFNSICTAALDSTTRKTLLLVLDTFEEVSQRSAAHQAGLLKFVGDLQAILPRLRVVISGRGLHPDTDGGAETAGFGGRAEATGLVDELAKTVKPLELPELSPPESWSLLESLGSSNGGLNSAIVERVGGHPLSLKLAAQLVRTVATRLQKPAGELTSADLFGPEWVAHMSESLLYRRIIAHIPDQPLQRLADPGLVLRELTSGIIFNVLNEPCSLDLESVYQAQGLFERLKEFNQLVSVQSTQVVRHRPELRQRVLAEMISAKLPLCRVIWSSAARYYRDLDENRAEEMYCLLMLDESADVLAGRWQPGLEKALLKSRTEMPENARQYLDLMTLRAEGNADKAVDGDLKFQLLAEEMKLLLSLGNAKGALELFKSGTRGKQLSDESALYVVHVRALAQSGELDKAIKMAWGALERREKAQGAPGARYEELLLLCCQVARSQRQAARGLQRLVSKVRGRKPLRWDELCNKFAKLSPDSPRTTNILRISVEMLQLAKFESIDAADSTTSICAERALAMLRQMGPHYFGVDGALLVRAFAELSSPFASASEVRQLLDVPQVRAVLARDYAQVMRAHPDVAGGADEASAMGAALRDAIRARDEGQEVA